MKFVMQIKGVTPLLMHKDNLEWQDRMKAWIGDPDNKKKSVAGDDRTPGFTWLGSLYEADGLAVLEWEMILKALTTAGSKVIKKGMTTYKQSVASAVFLDGMTFPVLVKGKEVQVGGLMKKLHDEMDYAKHCTEAERCGFRLFAKRAGVNGSKHVRVRPRFDEWAVVVRGTVDTDELDAATFAKIVSIAGARVGLGDWRPSSPKAPGSYGMFTAELKTGK